MPPCFCKIAVSLFLLLEFNNIPSTFPQGSLPRHVRCDRQWMSTLSYSFFQCQPVKASWDFDIAGVCIDRVALFEATCILGCLTNLKVIFLPVPFLLGLNVSRRRKLQYSRSSGSASLLVLLKSCID